MKFPTVPQTPRFVRSVPACLLLLLMFLGWGTALRAADLSNLVGKASVGFDGTFRVGAWTEGLVELSPPAAGAFRLEIDAPDADDNVVTYSGPVVEFKADQRKPQILRCLFKSGRTEGELVFRVKSESATRWESRMKPDASREGAVRPALTYAKKLWISIGKPAGLGAPGAEANRETEIPFAFRALEETRTLPESWLGYQGIDSVILVANAGDKNGKRLIESMSPAQHRALEEWVGSGGQLLLGVGKNSKEFAGGPVGKWFPGKIEGEYQLRTFAPLQTFAGKPVRFDQGATSAQIQLDARQTLVPGVNGVLAGEYPFRLGRITFVALDLDHPLFEKWESVTRFYELLLIRGVDRSQNVTARKTGARLSHSGVSDLSTQWYQAVSNVEGVRRTSIWGNLALILGYLILVGPLDYFVVHRVLKRPELTWLTLPVWILVGAGCGLALARSSNGTQVRTNQVSVVDIDQGTGTVHGRSWWTLYSPETRRYTISGTAQDILPKGGESAASPPANGWWAPPENMVGGLYRKSGLQFGRRTYALSENESTLETVPLQVWSTKGFSSDWTGNAKPFVKSTLQSAGTGFGVLSGTITWELGEDLEDCVLVHGNRIFFPAIGGRGSKSRNLPTGIEWTPVLSSQSTQRDLRGFLTKIQIRSVATGASTNSKPVEEIQTVTGLYDVNSRNISEILTTLSFHEYSGGTDYTGLKNDILGQMDWSAHLRLGRGVLFGRIKKTALKLAIDPAASQTDSDGQEYTYIRSLLPVTRLQNVDLRNFDSPKKALEKEKEGEPATSGTP
ncbi:MAG: hypothetical protein U0903_17305 [Planctomycetales bacterium]